MGSDCLLIFDKWVWNEVFLVKGSMGVKVLSF